MNQTADMLLKLSATRTNELLRIDYTLTNVGARPYYVFTCIAGRNREPLPGRAYTAYRTAEEALHLLLGVAPIPDGMMVGVKIVPFSSHLDPGGRHSGSLEVPLPATEWLPYLPDQSEDVETVQARRVLVSTAYFTHESLFRPPQWDSHHGVFRAFGGKLFPLSEMLELNDPIQVHKRRDRFERF